MSGMFSGMFSSFLAIPDADRIKNCCIMFLILMQQPGLINISLQKAELRSIVLLYPAER